VRVFEGISPEDTAAEGESRAAAGLALDARRQPLAGILQLLLESTW